MSRTRRVRIFLLLLLRSPSLEGVVHQRVLNVNHHARRSVHAREFLDGKNRQEKRASAAAVGFGNFNPHETLREEFFQARRG